MLLATFEVKYRPFIESDATSTIKMTGKDEDDVRREFERMYARTTYQVVEINKLP